MNEEYTPNTNFEEAIVPNVLEETAIIAEDTRVVGNIRTKGHIAIAGTLEGDVVAAGNVVVSGSVRGNIEAGNVIVEAGQLIANIKPKGQVIIKDGVVLNGDIDAKELSLMGIVNGDIVCEGSVGLLSTARLNGDITCGYLGIEIGAKFNGNVEMK